MNKYLSIAIQDPENIIAPVLERNTKLQEVDLHLVRRVERGITTGFIDYGDIGVLNKPLFKRFYVQKDCSVGPLVRDIKFKLVGDGYQFLVGAYFESEYVFTPRDIDGLSEDLSSLDGFQKDYSCSIAPKSWKRSKDKRLKEIYHSGWQQLKLGINTDLEGRLLTEEVIKSEERDSWFGKKTVEVPRMVSRLIELSNDYDESHMQVLRELIRVCQAVEYGVGVVQKHARGQVRNLGELHLATVYPNNKDQILFSGKGRDGLAKSYNIFNLDNSRIFVHYEDINLGRFKVGSKKKEEPTLEDKTAVMVQAVLDDSFEGTDLQKSKEVSKQKNDGRVGF